MLRNSNEKNEKKQREEFDPDVFSHMPEFLHESNLLIHENLTYELSKKKNNSNQPNYEYLLREFEKESKIFFNEKYFWNLFYQNIYRRALEYIISFLPHDKNQSENDSVEVCEKRDIKKNIFLMMKKCEILYNMEKNNENLTMNIIMKIEDKKLAVECYQLYMKYKNNENVNEREKMRKDEEKKLKDEFEKIKKKKYLPMEKVESDPDKMMKMYEDFRKLKKKNKGKGGYGDKKIKRKRDVITPKRPQHIEVKEDQRSKKRKVEVIRLNKLGVGSTTLGKVTLKKRDEKEKNSISGLNHLFRVPISKIPNHNKVIGIYKIEEKEIIPDKEKDNVQELGEIYLCVMKYSMSCFKINIETKSIGYFHELKFEKDFLDTFHAVTDSSKFVIFCSEKVIKIYQIVHSIRTGSSSYFYKFDRRQNLAYDGEGINAFCLLRNHNNLLVIANSKKGLLFYRCSEYESPVKTIELDNNKKVLHISSMEKSETDDMKVIMLALYFEDGTLLIYKVSVEYYIENEYLHKDRSIKCEECHKMEFRTQISKDFSSLCFLTDNNVMAQVKKHVFVLDYETKKSLKYKIKHNKVRYVLLGKKYLYYLSSAVHDGILFRGKRKDVFGLTNNKEKVATDLLSLNLMFVDPPCFLFQDSKLLLIGTVNGNLLCYRSVEE